MKIRHILITLLAVLAIAFMQPLVFFLGGLALLLGAGVLIFRDLPPVTQDAVEHRVLGWLRRARAGAAPEPGLATGSQRQLPGVPPEPGIPTERSRRVRTRLPNAGGERMEAQRSSSRGNDSAQPP